MLEQAAPGFERVSNLTLDKFDFFLVHKKRPPSIYTKRHKDSLAENPRIPGTLNKPDMID